MPQLIKKLFSLNGIIISFCIILIFFNLFHIGVYSVKKYYENQRLPVYLEPGTQFEKFKPFLKDIKTAGYITNKAITREDNDGILLQAQYFLAPTILELQSKEHLFSIIDSEDPKFIIQTIRSLNAMRMTNNEYGQALLLKRQ